MHSRVLVALAVLAALMAGAPALAAADTSSLAAFVQSCDTDTKACHNFTHDIIAAAKNADYDCIPKTLSADDGGNQLLTWMKDTAAGDPKYASMAVEDVAWAGVDALWACKAQ